MLESTGQIIFCHARLANIFFLFRSFRWVHESPDALKANTRPEGLGISGGLINAAVLAISNDFDSLYQASVVTAGFVCRLCEVAGTVSRAVEEEGSDGSRGSWGCAVIGSSPDALDRILDQIQEEKVSGSGNRLAATIFRE